MAIVALLLAVELFFVGAILVALQDSRAKLANERHLVDVVTQSSHIGNMMQRLGTVLAQDAMTEKLQQMVGTGESVKAMRAQINSEFASLKKLARGDAEILAIVESQQIALRKATKLYRADKAYFKIAKEDRIYSDTMLVADDLSAEYRKLLERFKRINQDAPLKTSRSITSVKQLIYGGLILNLVAALTLAMFFVRNVTSRIGQLCNNMANFQNDQPLSPLSSQKDEIGQLDQMFRGMIAILDEVRRREKALIDGAYDVICIIDSCGNFTTVNAACMRQWGYEKGDLIGQHYSSIISSDKLSVVSHQLSKSRRLDAFVNFETVVVRKGGEESDCSWSCFWSAADDANFCFVRDISEINNLKRMLQACEEQIRDLMNNVPIALSVIDEGGKVSFANRKMENLAHLPQDKLIGLDIFHLLEPGLNPEDRGSFDINKISGQASYSCFFKCATGQRINVEIFVETLANVLPSERKSDEVPVDKTAAGEASSQSSLSWTTSSGRNQTAESVVFIEDVEERVRLETLKRDFISILREKLHGPLVAVRDSVEKISIAENVLRPDSACAPDVEKERVRITRILTSTNRLLKLIDELLTIESLEPGKLVGELKQATVSLIVGEAIDSLEDYANKQGIKLRASTCEDLILADSGRLTQVLINLISNAIKFSPGGSEVVVAAVQADEFVEFSVTDSGRGVAASDQELIFKPYVQSTSDDAKKGTGLGLPICKAIVESHNGRIGIVSESGAGSRFWFLIPRSGG